MTGGLLRLVDRVRWRLVWWLMPPLQLAREKRRLQQIAKACGVSRAQSFRIASDYFDTLRDES